MDVCWSVGRLLSLLHDVDHVEVVLVVGSLGAGQLGSSGAEELEAHEHEGAQECGAVAAVLRDAQDTPANKHKQIILIFTVDFKNIFVPLYCLKNKQQSSG